MTKSEEKKFIAECKSWLNPPTGWMHGVALKGYKVDCIQFLAAVAKAVGWLDQSYEIKPYPREWALHQSESKMMKELLKLCDPVKGRDFQVGDILLFKFNKCNSHAAFYLGNNKAIHSHIQYGVAEFGLDDPEMKKTFTTAMRWKGAS
ncbi:MAG: C40 family peptidase [Candidatus Omnitrophica bacterium]|nr:C40 family peptidase [Candidatus Omnitrophota bacterium]